MQRILRTSASLPLAGLVTLSLAFFMSGLIRVEGTPNAEVPDLVVDLFPEVQVVNPPDRMDMVDIVAIESPPPPPAIEVEAASRPEEGLDIVVGGIPDFGDAVINSDEVNWTVSDRGAEPIIRIAPVYPPRALQRDLEGYCSMLFDISAEGVPFNIRASYCTHGMFERNSIRAMHRWRYSPRIDDGIAVVQRGQSTQIDFTLTD